MKATTRLRSGAGHEPTRRLDLRGDALAREIQDVLKADKAAGSKLVLPQYRGGDAEFNGYCAIATAAYFFLSGGDTAKFQPMQHTDRHRSSHWWLKRFDGAIVDLIYGFGDDQRRYRHYAKGSPRGFMQTGYRRPGGRAAEVMRRVEVNRRAT